MVRTRKIKVNNIENKEIIMTVTMTIITMMRMRIKIGNRTKI